MNGTSWFMQLLVLGIALTASNYFYQLAATEKWGTAFERSFFQWVAILAVWIALRP